MSHGGGERRRENREDSAETQRPLRIAEMEKARKGKKRLNTEGTAVGAQRTQRKREKVKE
jgi:hypothetical protein